MDRKTCVLVYSSYSNSCKMLIDYIKSLHYDLPRVTGMTFLNADTKQIRDELIKHEVFVVPTLLVMYYNGLRQKFESEEIYVWIQSLNSILKGRNYVNEQPATTPVDQHQARYVNDDANGAVVDDDDNNTPSEVVNVSGTTEASATRQQQLYQADESYQEPIGGGGSQQQVASSAKMERSANIMNRAMQLQKQRDIDVNDDHKKQKTVTFRDEEHKQQLQQQQSQRRSRI